MNKAYNRCLFTRLPGKEASVLPGVGWIVCNSSVAMQIIFTHPAVVSCLKCDFICQLHVNQAAG